MLSQLIEKRTTVNVDYVCWNNASDLLAVAYEHGQVVVHKLNWQQIWSLDAPHENTKVIGMSWRPDGHVLAIVYDINETHIVEISHKEIVKKIHGNITYINWIEEVFSNRYTEYQKTNDDYIPKQVPLPPTNDEIAVDEFRKLSNQKSINFLILGHYSGLLEFYVYGIYHCFTIDLLKISEEKGNKFEILYCDIADDLKTVALIVIIDEKSKCFLINSNVLADRAQVLYDVTYRRAVFDVNLDYMERTINYIFGAWDKILSYETELKLNKYPGEDLSTDYLELLIRGFCPPHLRKFLTRELNENKLQEVARSIESLHCIMHKLLLYPLQLAVENVVHDLTLLQGMYKVSCEEKLFLHIEENLIEECLIAAGGYCIKSNEIISIVDASMAKYKHFFHWLCTVINKLNSDRKISCDEFTQYERDAVTQFICEMDQNHKVSAMKSVLSLYLHDDSAFGIKSNGNYPWLNLLKENPTLENCLLIMPSTFQNMSLMQLHKYLKSCSAKIFENYETFIKDFHILDKWTISDNAIKLSAVKNCHNIRLLIGYTKPCENGMYANVTKISSAHGEMETLSLYFNTEEYNQLYVNDMQFYSNEYLSVLLSVKNLFFYFHMPIVELSKKSYGKESIKNGFSMVSKMDDYLTVIDNMKPTNVIVSGIHNLILILTTDRRHLRIYSTSSNIQDIHNFSSYDINSKEIIAPDCSYGYHPTESTKDSMIHPAREYISSLNYLASLNYSPEEETINLNNVDIPNLHIS